WEYTPCNNCSTVYADADGDGYGDATNSIFVTDCIAPGGYVYNSNDCSDANTSIHPGAIDIINGIDDDCDGIIDPCPIPTHLLVNSITGTSAKLKWNAAFGAEGYTVRYKVSNTSEWT